MLKSLFTTADNTTFDLGRVLWAKFAMVYSVLSAWHLWHGGTFDPVAWSEGAAAVLTSGGGALLLKKSTEPPVTAPTPPPS